MPMTCSTWRSGCRVSGTRSVQDPHEAPAAPHAPRPAHRPGLVALLALACLAVGVSTALALRGFLLGRLDGQLTASGGRFAASLEHEARPDADNLPDTRGQADATFGARLLDGRVTRAAVVDDTADRPVPLTDRERHALAAVPVDGRGHSVRFTTLGIYRVVAVRGDDQDVLLTGLPLHPVEETVHRLVAVEAAFFGAALVVTGVAGALWVRFSLRPLRRVTARATEVTRLPLAGGEVAMPAPLADSDERTGSSRPSATSSPTSAPTPRPAPGRPSPSPWTRPGSRCG